MKRFLNIFKSWSLIAALSVVAAPACTVENTLVQAAPLDFDYFVCGVQPILERECSMPACHGNNRRPFQVLASGRMRISDEYESAKALLTSQDISAGKHPKLSYGELAANYYHALSFTQITQGMEKNQLITRPLVMRAGGMSHAPRADVFLEADDSRILAIEAWVAGATIRDCP